MVFLFLLKQEQEDTPTASLLNLEPTDILEVKRNVVNTIRSKCLRGLTRLSARCRLGVVGQSGDAEEDQGLAVGSGQ